MARQLYYRWLGSPVGRRELHGAYLANAVFDAHAATRSMATASSPTKPRAGEQECDRAVWRIRRDQQWWSASGERRGKNGKKPGPPAHDDKVKRDLHADRVTSCG